MAFIIQQRVEMSAASVSSPQTRNSAQNWGGRIKLRRNDNAAAAEVRALEGNGCAERLKRADRIKLMVWRSGSA
jgi:hypothetical protein